MGTVSGIPVKPVIGRTRVNSPLEPTDFRSRAVCDSRPNAAVGWDRLRYCAAS